MLGVVCEEAIATSGSLMHDGKNLRLPQQYGVRKGRMIPTAGNDGENVLLSGTLIIVFEYCYQVDTINIPFKRSVKLNGRHQN